MSTIALVSVHSCREETEKLVTSLARVLPTATAGNAKETITLSQDGSLPTVVPLCLRTRYYIAHVRLCVYTEWVHTHDIVTLGPEAMVIFFDVSSAFTCLAIIEQLNIHIVPYLKEGVPTVRILAVVLSDDGSTDCQPRNQSYIQNTLLKWAVLHHFELLFPFQPDAMNPKENYFLEAIEDHDVTLSSLVHALECHTWTSLQHIPSTLSRHGHDKSLQPHMSIPQRDSVEQQTFEDTLQYEQKIQQALSSKEIPQDCEHSLHHLDEMFNKVSRVRQRALSRSISDQERRTAATEMLHSLLNAIEFPADSVD